MATEDSRPYDLVLRGARLLDQQNLVDIAIRDGKIASISTDLDDALAARTVNADGSLVVQRTEPHFHLDKTLTRERFGATSYSEGFERARTVKVGFTAADVEARACEALRLALAHGIGAVKAQGDV